MLAVQLQPVHSLQSVTESAMAIKQCLTEGTFNHARAQNLAEQLYKDAQDLIRAEYSSNPLFPEPVTSVAITLDEIVSMPTLQKFDDLHRALSKTYRVFIELTWFQCWRQKSRYNANESIEAIISHSDQMMKLLPKNQSSARFEYSCVRQAAQFLNPIDSIWFKYIDLIPTIEGVAVNPSIGQMLDAMKDATGFAKHDWIKVGCDKLEEAVFVEPQMLQLDFDPELSIETELDLACSELLKAEQFELKLATLSHPRIKAWYLDVHSLRWLSTTVKTIYDFMREIFPKLETFEENGGKYSECLAVICIELVRNPQVKTQCRKYAAGELSQLLSLVEVNKTSRILKAMQSRLPNVGLVGTFVRKADRYKKTREIIKDFLAEVANNQDFHECKPLLKESINFKSISESPALNFGEYEQLSTNIALLTGEMNTSQHHVELLLRFLQKTKGLAENQAKREKAEAEIHKEQQNIERIKAQIDALWNFEKEWGQAFIKEQKELEEIIQKL